MIVPTPLGGARDVAERYRDVTVVGGFPQDLKGFLMSLGNSLSVPERRMMQVAHLVQYLANQSFVAGFLGLV